MMMCYSGRGLVCYEVSISWIEWRRILEGWVLLGGGTASEL